MSVERVEEQPLPGMEPAVSAGRAASAGRPAGPAAAARPEMVRVAPGRNAWIPAAYAQRTPDHVLCRWSRQADGSYTPVPMPYRYVRMTPETTAMLGFVSGNRRVRADTLLRLAAAGFIDCVQISPACWMIDLDSWFRHLAECMEDPEYWDAGGEARERYNAANGLGVEH